MSYTPPQVLFGAAYYHEYQPTPRLRQDFDEMKAAGFSVIRIGESVWSTWEPSDGEFDLEWITPVLDGGRVRHRRDPRHADLRDPAVAAAPLPRAERRDRHRQAVRVGHAPRDRRHPRRVPLPCRAGGAQDPRAPCVASGHHRLPGRQRARRLGDPQPRRLRAVPRPPADPLRHGRGHQRGVGPDLLVAPPVGPGATSGGPTPTSCRSTTSPGVSSRPSCSPSTCRGRPRSSTSTPATASS